MTGEGTESCLGGGGGAPWCRDKGRAPSPATDLSSPPTAPPGRRRNCRRSWTGNATTVSRRPRQGRSIRRRRKGLGAGSPVGAGQAGGVRAVDPLSLAPAQGTDRDQPPPHHGVRQLHPPGECGSGATLFLQSSETQLLGAGLVPWRGSQSLALRTPPPLESTHQSQLSLTEPHGYGGWAWSICHKN